ASLGGARTIAMRHLGRPTVISDGPIATAVEFDETPFGDTQASRKSGRADAFLWPSMTRIGTEALSLQTRDLATPGTTGLTNLRSHLNDVSPHASVWRVARDAPLTATPGGTPGPVASGLLLAHLTEDGSALPRLLTGPGANTPIAPALRPRFSPSAMMTHFIAELLLHTLSSINAPHGPAQRDRSAITRTELDRIVIVTAAGVPEDERQRLIERAQDAVDIIWRSLGWAGRDDNAARPKPLVVPGLGPDLAAQVIYVHDNLRQRFGGNAQVFVDLTRRPRHRARLAPDLRIASIDAGDHRTTLAVVDYALPPEGATGDAALLPSLASARAHDTGTTAMIDAIAAKLIEPAIVRALANAGIDDAPRFLADITGPWHLAMPINDPHFAQRFKARVLLPAARALFESYAQNAADTGVEIEARLEALVARDANRRNVTQRASARPAPRLGATTLALMFDASAERAGAMGLRLADVPLKLRWLDIEQVVRPHVDTLVQAVAKDLIKAEADLVLLTGALMRVEPVLAHLRGALSMPSARVIELAKGRFTLIDAFGSDTLRSNPASTPRPWLTGVVGAFVASRPETAAPADPAPIASPSRQLTDRRSDPPPVEPRRPR
ncbi:MAG: hypothetical protein RL291_984, partial [Pseudomonadota bacterium]